MTDKKTNAKKAFTKQSPLDVDLWVDRAAKPGQLLTLDLEVPPVIRLGETVQMRIVDYDATQTYTIQPMYGSARVFENVIEYTAPGYLPPGNNEQLDITVETEVKSLVYLPDGTIYDINGQVFGPNKRGLIPLWAVDMVNRITIDYEKLMRDAKNSVPRMLPPGIVDIGDVPTINADEFRVHEFFPLVEQRRWQNDDPPSGGVEDYNVPHNVDTTANDSPYIYRLKTVKQGDDIIEFQTFESRNANTDEALGNVNEGYRYPGAIGSSLSVFSSGDELDKTFRVSVPIDLWELEAIVPDELMSLCVTNIEIVPIFRGIEDGHTFLWEQISGDPGDVEWLSDPTDSILILKFGEIKVDRVFRFWISKGTKWERYYDVVIYATPREVLNGHPNTNNQFTVTGPVLNIHRHDTRPILLTGERITNNRLRAVFIETIL